MSILSPIFVLKIIFLNSQLFCRPVTPFGLWWVKTLSHQQKYTSLKPSTKISPPSVSVPGLKCSGGKWWYFS
jgi:hypothetical protein